MLRTIGDREGFFLLGFSDEEEWAEFSRFLWIGPFYYFYFLFFLSRK